MIKQTSSQTIKQILELCEAYDMPPNLVSLVKNKCWKLVRNEKENIYADTERNDLSDSIQ